MPLCTILAKCPAPTGPACTKPSSPGPRLQRVEDRHRALDVSAGAADHQAVAVGWPQTPPETPTVDVADAALAEQLRARRVVA